MTFLVITLGMYTGGRVGGCINLIPMRSILITLQYGMINAANIVRFLLNMAMFTPLGLLLPLVSQRMRGFLPVLSVSAGLSLLAEALQLAAGRVADIDDLIANLLGGLLGVYALHLWRRHPSSCAKQPW